VSKSQISQSWQSVCNQGNSKESDNCKSCGVSDGGGVFLEEMDGPLKIGAHREARLNQVTWNAMVI